MSRNLTDTVWQIIDKKILSMRSGINLFLLLNLNVLLKRTFYIKRIFNGII